MRESRHVILKKSSMSKYAGEVLCIEEISKNKANLSQNGKIVVLGIDIKYLRRG